MPILDRTYDNDPGVHDDPAIFYVALSAPSANTQIDDSVGYAYVEDDDYTIYPTAGSGGVMTPNTPETVESGADSSVYTIQGTGCIKDIKDNGTSVFTPSTDPSPCDHSDPSSACNQTTYQVLNVTEDHTVAVTFRTVFTFKGLIEPEDVRSPYGRWRLIDESATVAAGHDEVFVGGDAEGWNEHGDEVTLNCAHTTYTMQFRDVPGYFKPAEQAFEVPHTNTVHPVVRTGTYTSRTYTLTIHIAGGTGGESISIDPPAPEEGGHNVYVFEAGSDPVVHLTATGAPDPDPTYFRRWEGAVTDLYNITTAITMDGNKTVTVYFDVPGVDADGDGYVAGTDPGQDCDDTNPDIHPDAVEICGNAVDENCDGSADPCGAADLDDDGDGYTENMGDCDDSDAAIHPGADEICGNDVDEDCYDGPRDCGVEVTCVDYAEAPLETQAQAAPPNIMFLLDDSGSMTWSFHDLPGRRDLQRLLQHLQPVRRHLERPAVHLPPALEEPVERLQPDVLQPGDQLRPLAPLEHLRHRQPAVNADPDNPRSNPMNATPTLNLNDTFMTITVAPPENQHLTVRRQSPDGLSMSSNTAADAIGLHPSASGALGSGATPAVVVDNKDSGAAGEQGTFAQTGSWSESGSPNEWDGSCYYTSTTGASATWTPNVPASGPYRVYAWVNEYASRDPNADYTIYHADGGDGETEYTVLMNQGLYGGRWYQLNRSGETDSLYHFNTQTITTAAVDIRNAHYFIWKDHRHRRCRRPGRSFSDQPGRLRRHRHHRVLPLYRHRRRRHQPRLVQLRRRGRRRADGVDRRPGPHPGDHSRRQRGHRADLRPGAAELRQLVYLLPPPRAHGPGGHRPGHRQRRQHEHRHPQHQREHQGARGAHRRDRHGGQDHRQRRHGYAESGTWSNSTSASPYEGDARYTSATGAYATFTPTFATGEAGVYRVWAWWNCYADRDSNAQFTIVHAGGTATVYKDQRQGGADGCGQWVLLGQYSFNAGAGGSVKVMRHGGSTGEQHPGRRGPFEATSTTTVFNQSDYLMDKLYKSVSTTAAPRCAAAWRTSASTLTPTTATAAT